MTYICTSESDWSFSLSLLWFVGYSFLSIFVIATCSKRKPPQENTVKTPTVQRTATKPTSNTQITKFDQAHDFVANSKKTKMIRAGMLRVDKRDPDYVTLLDIDREMSLGHADLEHMKNQDKRKQKDKNRDKNIEKESTKDMDTDKKKKTPDYENFMPVADKKAPETSMITTAKNIETAVGVVETVAPTQMHKQTAQVKTESVHDEISSCKTAKQYKTMQTKLQKVEVAHKRDQKTILDKTDLHTLGPLGDPTQQPATKVVIPPTPKHPKAVVRVKQSKSEKIRLLLVRSKQKSAPGVAKVKAKTIKKVDSSLVNQGAGTNPPRSEYMF